MHLCNALYLASLPIIKDPFVSNVHCHAENLKTAKSFSPYQPWCGLIVLFTKAPFSQSMAHKDTVFGRGWGSAREITFCYKAMTVCLPWADFYCMLKTLWQKICKSTHSLINHFETVPNSKKLQMSTEIWQLQDFKYRLHGKHCGRRWNCSFWAISPFSTMFSESFIF